MKNRNEKIFVRVIRAGFIPQLGMCGPIPNPIKVTRQTAYEMISSNIEVYEVDPVTKEATQLTLQSVFNEDTAPEVTKVEATNVKKVKTTSEPVEFKGVTKATVVSEPEPVKEEVVDETPVEAEVAEETAEVKEEEVTEAPAETENTTNKKKNKKKNK